MIPRALAVVLLGSIALGAGWWLARGTGEPAPTPPTALAAPTLAPATPEPPRPETDALAPGAPGVPDAAVGSIADRLAGGSLEGDAPERLLQDETMRQRIERLAMEEAARERFDTELEHSGITAAEVEDGVKRLFETVRIEPVLLPGGRMDGMILRDLPPEHPLRRAGFTDGDRLVRLDEFPLDDAAQLPHIFIRLERTFSACVVRDGQERCGQVTVDAPT